MYIAVTAAVGCFLGVSVTQRADAEALKQAYGEVQLEAHQSYPEDCPESVNTDGWEATQQAWNALFPNITIVLRFLRIVLSVQQLYRRASGVFKLVTDKLWHLWQFAQRLRRLEEWAKRPEYDLPDKARQKLITLPNKAPQLKVTFALPDAYRISKQVDL
ncbi:MAG: hypothetical protein IGR76_01485 [Synechococcales cyanobacterium T60_A2020_003]|nr:hypothetical protein [Synechococcales cyanobacterium T60_A2020_003]